MKSTCHVSSPRIDPVSSEVFARFTECISTCADFAERDGSGGQYLLVPLVMAIHCGKAPSVEERLTEPPRPVPTRFTCTIDAAGQVYERGEACRSDKTPSGRVFYPFKTDGEPFKLWALHSVYTSFIGPVPSNCKVEPLDGNHENLRLDNLVLRYLPPNDIAPQQNWRNQ